MHNVVVLERIMQALAKLRLSQFLVNCHDLKGVYRFSFQSSDTVLYVSVMSISAWSPSKLDTNWTTAVCP